MAADNAEEVILDTDNQQVTVHCIRVAPIASSKNRNPKKVTNNIAQRVIRTGVSLIENHSLACSVISVLFVLLQLCILVWFARKKKNVPPVNPLNICHEIGICFRNCKKNSEFRNVELTQTTGTICCSNRTESLTHLVKMFLMVLVPAADKGTLNFDSNLNSGLRIHESTFLDTRNLQNIESNDRLPWNPKQHDHHIHFEVPYSRMNRSFHIEKGGLYHIHTSLAFNIKTSSEKKMSCRVYRKRKKDEVGSVLMNKTMTATENDKNPAYFHLQIDGLFNLYKGDELFVMADNTADILRYVVCNSFGIYRIKNYPQAPEPPCRPGACKGQGS